MEELKPIQSALISVYHKDRVDIIARHLHALDIQIFSTGGTFDYIQSLGIPVTTVESLTSYPSILGGRVKTLHPKVFGGILYRREFESDQSQIKEYDIPPIDLVMVDLYPFESTVASGSAHEDIIEKIDIGGISLIRAAAKNYRDVVIIPSAAQYDDLIRILEEKKGFTSLQDRYYLAAQAFNVSSHYDTAIFNYFNKETGIKAFKKSILQSEPMRYGENPHQEGTFYGDTTSVFEQHNGKAISYNNLVDLDAAIALISEFNEPTFAIIKHTNACGVATRQNLTEAWKDALAGDPISAFGGVIATNRIIDTETAEEINKLFFEIIIAPDYEKNALEILKSKKNRIILQHKPTDFQAKQFKSVLNGLIEQDKDNHTEGLADMKVVTHTAPDNQQFKDLIFANILVKHLKSNAIVLAKNSQLLGSGCGMTSRVDALKHAIKKAAEFGLDLHGAVMASDAYFPFADSVGIASESGIKAVIQPGGSVRDEDSIRFCNENGIPMVFTGIRHFKH
ncbi:MAG: bifunctional phosphoribosylaminoimidazolecarboxamide formyltransferase/IMP cyclohydrolase [Bacteroidales bacterium]|nr:bifunctional phosphoribosylaminoimidazolecarboxamide formyltransferase/IMP cyclohydrolase [Bacteroidales bacterium]